MTSAYGGVPGTGTKGLEDLTYLPLQTTLKNGRKVEIGPADEHDWPLLFTLLNEIIEEGRGWPFDAPFDTMDKFCGYFLSHAAFVVRGVELGIDSNNEFSPGGEILGTFYIKPNYPGRCSHICNGGFITRKQFRRQGVGRLMASCFLKFARDLGYKGSYFNLVFETNQESISLWDGLGFQRVSTLPQCADLKGIDYLVDAYGYHYNLASLPQDLDPLKLAASKPESKWLKNAGRRYANAAPFLLPVAIIALAAMAVLKLK